MHIKMNDSLLCFYYPRIDISLLYLVGYLSILFTCSSCYKPHNVAYYTMSTIACWYFVLTNDLDNMIAYYIYDTVISIIKIDIIIILHHVVTLIGIFTCPSVKDYFYLISVLNLFKISDLFLHHAKILDAINFDKKYHHFVRIWKLFTLSYSIIMWIIFRVIIMSSYLPLLYSPHSYIILTSLIIASLWWIKKMIILYIKIYNGYYL